MQPFCSKCCGEHTKAGNTLQKRRARRIEKRRYQREIMQEVFDYVHAETVPVHQGISG